MKRLAWLFLLPLASGALFAQTTYSITPSSLPAGTVGVQYTTTTLSLTPTYALVTWSVSAGSLPTGLSLSTTGTISGTPTAVGGFPFTVQATLGGTFNGAIFVKQDYNVTIVPPALSLPAASLPNGTVGVSYSQSLTASGGYGPGTFTFALASGSLPPGLQLSTGGLISGTPTTAASYTFTVTVSSQAGTYAVLTASGTFTITINPPALTITTTSLPAGTVGVAYSQALAATGGTPPYAWRLGTGSSLPGGLTVASSGTISGTPTTAGSFTFQVILGDSMSASATGTVSIKINPTALAITTTSLPGGTIGVSYPATTLAATGGTPPYTWSVATGAFPAGLSLSSAGVISGTPTLVPAGPGGVISGTSTAAGTFSFTVKVTDSAQATAIATFSITVAAAPATLSITTQAPLAGGEVGVPYTQAFAATGGSPPYQWSVSAGAAPTGLTLNASTGSLTGTPTAAGTFSFTLQVADSAGRTATASFTVTVIAAVKITAATPPAGVTGVSYSQQFAATGGLSPYTWSIATGSIPTGLSLSTATGLLSGTPTTAATYTFTLTVTDQNGGTNSATFSITIAAPAPLTITTQYPLPGSADGMVGVPFSLVFAATGGASPYQWSVSAGALPTGLTLSAAGSLTGSPTAAGTFNFTVQVADSAGHTATASYSIVVVQLTITTASPLPAATVGTPYNLALTVSGSGEPYLVTYTWSLASGALPPGIALNPGSLNGIPSAPGTFTFTVTAAGGGQTATAPFTLTVGVPAGPPATITGLPATATPATQPALGITIPSAYPLAITGTVTLTFAPDSPSPDGGEVVFTTGGRTVSFTVAANTTQVAFSGATPAVQTGTVSGTITLTLDLKAAGIDITPTPAPSTTIVVPKSAPKISTASVTGVTSSGFNLVVVGYATSRDMASATVTFTAASGVTLGSTSATVSLTSAFTTWYQSTASAAYGSNFSLTIPFTIANGTGTAPLASVSVMLTNSQGNSTTVSAVY